MLWNLFKLANALYSLIDEAEPLQAVLEEYRTDVEVAYLKMMYAKLGLEKEVDSDAVLVLELEEVLQLSETDMTIFFRNLSVFSAENPSEGLQIIQDAFYTPDSISEEIKEKWNTWFTDYTNRLQKESISAEARKKKMNQVNPKYVLRNYMSQLAIDDANKGDYKLIDELFQLLKKDCWF